MTTNLEIVLARLADELAETSLRVAEIEADLLVERQRRLAAERQLQAKIEADDLEKFNAFLSNSVEIDQLEGRVGVIEHALGRTKPPRPVVLMPLRATDPAKDRILAQQMIKNAINKGGAAMKLLLKSVQEYEAREARREELKAKRAARGRSR